MDGQEILERNSATPLSEQTTPESQANTNPETTEASTTKQRPHRLSPASAKRMERSLASEQQDALSPSSENPKEKSTPASKKQKEASLASETSHELPPASGIQKEQPSASDQQNGRFPVSAELKEPSPASTSKQQEMSSVSASSPTAPSATTAPTAPTAPTATTAPTAPTASTAPTAPTATTAPTAPTASTAPTAPTATTAPTASTAPTTPTAPTVPTAPTAPAPKRVSSSRRRMERELLRMQEADENARLRYKDKKQKEVRKAVAAMYARKKKEGVTLTPDVESSRAAIRTIMTEEERMALAKDQKILRKETKDIRDSLDKKYGVKEKKRGPNLLALAEDFYHNKVHDRLDVPEHVRRQLTKEEIQDLKMVFDMFDVRGRGYITANDVKRAASMLGFKAKKEVFKGMIGEATGDTKGRVSFVHFLQFVVRGQGAGGDPLDDILQCFRLLDHDQKGYITVDDLREVADSQKVPLSNRAIREMIQEADVSGDARVTSDEFVHIMLQTGMFHATR